MAMALYATKRGAHYGLPGSVHPIHYGRCSELFIVGSTLIIRHRITVKSGGNKFCICWVGH